MRRFASSAVAVAVAIALGGAAAAGLAGNTATPAPPRGAALSALAQPVVRPQIANDRFYFVMTDRYANGDTANDRGGVSGPREATGYDPTDPGWFHGGDLAGLTGGCTDATRGLARIRDLGFTAIWITPPYRQKYVQGDSAAYHGYWITGFDQVDPHFGTEAEFRAFVDCAHALGLKVYLDVVVNHTADVIQLPSYEYGRPKTPIVPAAERNAKSPAWLNDASNYHNRGNIDFSNCAGACLELGDFFGLDDLATEQADVRDGLAAVYADWIRRYRVDGFRIDTAKHVDARFFRLWVPKIMAAARDAGVPNFQLFGEVFENNAVELSTFVRNRGLPNVLDFPLQDAIARFAGGSAGASGIADRLRDDDYFTRGNVAHTPPTFIGNHDIGRAALQVRDKGGAGAAGALLQRTLLAHDLLYVLRGAPVVYYGDEFGIIGRGGDKQARQDLFPTRVLEWQNEERLVGGPIGGASSFDRQPNAITERLRTLATLRQAHSALRTGGTAVRLSTRTVLAVSRFDAAAKREYIAVVNAGTSAANVVVPSSTPLSRWRMLLGTPEHGRVESAPDATVSLAVPPLSTVLLLAERELPPRTSGPTLRVTRDSLSDYIRATASVRGRAPATISFAVRRAGSPRWALVAADDSPPYRAFLDPRAYRRRERIHVVAIVRGLDGTLSTSAVVGVRPRR